MEFDIGAHCAFKECGLLDFLPFECKQCRKVFCKDHWSTTAHQCVAVKASIKSISPPGSNAPQSAASPNNVNIKREDSYANFLPQIENHSEGNKFSNPSETQKRIVWLCQFNGCKPKPNNNIWCDCKTCNKRFCLLHRLPEDHHCVAPTKATPKYKPPAKKTKPKVFSVPSTVPPAPSLVSQSNGFGSQSKSKIKNRLKAMRCKAKAKGDASILEANRLYVRLKIAKSCNAILLRHEGKQSTENVFECASGAQTFDSMDSHYVWLDAAKSVGWNIDYLCRYFHLMNKNGISHHENEHMFLYQHINERYSADASHTEGHSDRLLLVSKSVCGTVLLNGDDIILQRGK